MFCCHVLNTVIQVAETRSEIGFDIWLLETCQLCLIFIRKGHFFCWKKSSKAIKANECQQRPALPKTSKFFVVITIQCEYDMYQKNVFFRNWKFYFHYIKSLKLHFVENVKCTNRYKWNNGTGYFICLYITWKN